jgi:hypothetical protein
MNNGESLENRITNNGVVSRTSNGNGARNGAENHTLRIKRNPFLFNIAKGLAWSLIKTTSYKHYELPEETHELMKKQYEKRDISIYYAAPHKSMWETIGIPFSISWHDGDVPFIMMGNNLIKKETGKIEALLKYLGDRSGLVSVEREINPRAAVPIIISDISKILSANRNVLIFAEGTRSRNGLIQDFKPAGFQGLAQAVSNGAESYIIPVNVDYSSLIEAQEFAAQNELGRIKAVMLSQEFSELNISERKDLLRNNYYKTRFIQEDTFKNIYEMINSQTNDLKEQWSQFEKSYTFKIKDSKRWKANIGDVYISFGDPMYIAKNDSKEYRKELAEKSKIACMDLVKIQSINIVSEAILRMNPRFGEPIKNNELYESIIGVVKDVSDYSDKFRGFDIFTKPKQLIKKSDIKINSEFLELYKIYSNYIGHYLPNRH